MVGAEGGWWTVDHELLTLLCIFATWLQLLHCAALHTTDLFTMSYDPSERFLGVVDYCRHRTPAAKC